jgi:DNA repair exonuclease SbcCD nuclease subunit
MSREVCIVHTSDIHLDASFRATGVPSAHARERCAAHLEAFDRVVELARAEGADVLLIAGDLFEASHARPATVRHVAKRLAAWGKPVCIAPGNHDPIRPDSVYSLADWPENVTLFEGSWSATSFPELGLAVHGRGFTEPEEHGRLMEGLDIPDPGTLNVVVAHGSDESSRPDRHQPYRPFTASELDRLPVAYVALGHYHKHAVLPTQLVAAVYSGSPIPQGFHDQSEHGALRVRLTRESVDVKLCALPARRFVSVDVDVSGCDTEAEVAARARAALLERKTQRDFARVFLRGSVPTDFELDTSTLRESLSACAHVVELRDDTWPEYDLEAVAQEGTVRGNFVRTLSARLQETPEEERETIRRAIYFGLDAFTGRPQVR